MSFGETIMKKFGWSEGKGLGREENGIKTFVKPKLKSNLSGVGYSESNEHSFQWWDHVYNKAANNISVKKKETGAVEIVRKDDLKISTKKSSLEKNRELSRYGNFVKGSVLEGNKIIENTNTQLSTENEKSLELIKNYTDQELFKMCGGLTAHKGARHGIKMSAKLARLEEQEKKFLQKSYNINNPDERKRKRHDDDTTSYDVNSVESEISNFHNIEANPIKKNKKKKKKKKKEEEQQHNSSENSLCSQDALFTVEQENFPSGDNEIVYALKHKSKKKKKKRKKEHFVEF